MSDATTDHRDGPGVDRSTHPGGLATSSPGQKPHGQPWHRHENGPLWAIRDARPEDVYEVAGVHVRSWQVAYRGLLPYEYLDGLRAEDRMAHYSFGDAEPGQAATIVAEKDGAICGFASKGPARDRDAAGAGEIYAIYVDPPAWGRGAGRSLMAEARAQLRRQGFAAAVLWVLATNQRAQRFYQADGWQPDGQQREQEVWGILADEVRYSRNLH